MKCLYVKTIGPVEESTLNFVTNHLSMLTPFTVKITKSSEYPLFAFEPKRNQYYSKKIIEKLAIELPKDCEKLIAITDIDLCTPVLSFVFGEAQLDGKIAIVSYRRLQQEFYKLPNNHNLTQVRLLKECVHELGHCYGLYHCNNTQCVMFFSHTIFNIDGKQCDFCVRCREFVNEKMEKEKHA